MRCCRRTRRPGSDVQPTTTRVDAILTALLAEFRALWPNDDVLDGPSTADDNTDTVLEIGTSVDENGEAYSSEQTVDGLANRVHETIVIRCGISTWSGGDSSGQAPLRATVVSRLAQIDNYLRANPTLGGVCDRVYLGRQFRYYVQQTPDGPGCGAAFEITAEAYL